MDFVCELLNIRDPKMLSRGIQPRDRRKLENALKGVNVEVTHRKSNRQVLLRVFVSSGPFISYFLAIWWGVVCDFQPLLVWKIM